MEIDTETMRPVYGPHDWPEDGEHENGDYECRCVVCDALFWGHKRRVVCKVCADEAARRGRVWMTRSEVDELFRAQRMAGCMVLVSFAVLGFLAWLFIKLFVL